MLLILAVYYYFFSSPQKQQADPTATIDGMYPLLLLVMSFRQALTYNSYHWPACPCPICPPVRTVSFEGDFTGIFLARWSVSHC